MSVFKRLKNIIRSHVEDIVHKDEPIAEESTEDETWKRGEHHASSDSASTDTLAAKYYGNLELPYGASKDEVKKKYRLLLRKYHPDLHSQDEKKRKIAEEITVQLNEAYNYLMKN